MITAAIAAAHKNFVLPLLLLQADLNLNIRYGLLLAAQLRRKLLQLLQRRHISGVHIGSGRQLPASFRVGYNNHWT